MFKILAIFALLFLVPSAQAQAIDGPLSVPNNRFGIHIVDENDLDDAARLVNSTGGDWGYVKLVIREDDRKVEKWQQAFDKMRRLHLIPIVRLATRIENGRWIKPRVEDIDSWMDFLSSLNWVTENRYLILFNEPNHAKEWGDEINPEEYAYFAKEFSTRLKNRNVDFFILPAGLDASAPNSSQTLDEAEFIRRMYQADKQIFSYFDGWTSHSYPNPDFSASPFQSGRGSLKTYLWELGILANYGFYPDKIFITETGWAHNQERNNGYLSPTLVADYYKTAFSQSWNDSRIVAITPFLLNYQDELFGRFSWKKLNSKEFYPMFETVQILPKIKGKPKQRKIVKFDTFRIPETLVINSKYNLYLGLENLGQAIVGENDNWAIEYNGLDHFTIDSDGVPLIEPNNKSRLSLKLKTPSDFKKYNYSIRLLYKNEEVNAFKKSLTLIPPPSLAIFLKKWINKPAIGDNYRLLIYDENEILIYQKANLAVEGGFVEVTDLYGVIPDRPYRIVVLKDYYLPRQVKIVIGQVRTGIEVPILLPLDFSNDEVFNFSDLVAFFRNPITNLKRLLALD